MTPFEARSFLRDRRAQFRWQQANRSTAEALAWDDAVETAIDELVAAPAGYAYAHDSDALPDGPYRAKNVRRRPQTNAPHRLPRNPRRN